MSIDTLLHLANNSGGVLYAIAAMLLVALTVIIERFWYLYRVAQSCRLALQHVDQIEVLNANALNACALEFKGLPVSGLFVKATRLAGQATREELEAGIGEVIMREVPHIDRFLWVLDTIVTLAPLLGLFGTIVGMFNAFQVLSNPGNAPAQVTGGVAQALIATASGLFVAMIGLVFFNGFHNRVRVLAHQLETLKVALVNRLATPAPASAAAHETLKFVRETPRAGSGSLATQGAGA